MGIDIKGLDKAKLLAALYNGSKPQGLGFLHFNPAPMTTEQAQAILDSGQRDFDYLQGRVMKIDLSGDDLSPWGYDRDNGAGAVQQIIDELRRTNDVNTELVERRHLENTYEAAADLKEHLFTPIKVEETPSTRTVTLGVGDDFSRLLTPILLKVLGDQQSPDIFISALLSGKAEPTLTPIVEEPEVIEPDVVGPLQRSWYLVKKHPQSEEAKRIAGQLIYTLDLNPKENTVAVFTFDMLTNNSGVAIRIPTRDLTNR